MGIFALLGTRLGGGDIGPDRHCVRNRAIFSASTIKRSTATYTFGLLDYEHFM